ncbi:MAG TPA: DUF4136 domain-containing protein, partial [Allosphingosinicella sp.]|nr:DUF4136 domain-containing protein [Allosphingosinicella sp.]
GRGRGGCATGLPTQVSRFQAMPAPAGQTFVIQAAHEEDRGGLEFSRYADLVRRHMLAQGYSEAGSPASASLIVSLGYGVDDGRQQVVSRPGLGGYSRFGYGGFGYRPYWSRFGGYGRLRSPFYYGWDDPLWYRGGGFGDELDVYTVYKSFVDMDIRRPDGQAVFEGTAQARSRTDELGVLVPNLIEAMFTGFPGNSGETVKITVAPERKR